MSRVYDYMFISVGVTLMLKFAGIPSGADALISWIGLSSTPSGVSLGAFFVGVIALFVAGGALGSGIRLGFLSFQPTETSLMSAVSTGILTVITGTWISIINYTSDMGYIFYLIQLMFVPFLIAFFVAVTEFWRGTG